MIWSRRSRTICWKLFERIASSSASFSTLCSRTVRLLDRSDRLPEAQRVGDLVAREGVDHEPLAVVRGRLLLGQVEVEDALVDARHALDERDLHVEAGLRHGRDGLAEAEHDDLLGLA